MAKSWYHTLESRGFIRIDGPDRVEFLQGLVSNDVTRVTAARAGYGAFLTAQGKFLFDFFLIADGDALVPDTEGARVGDFFRRLRLSKLRSPNALIPGRSETHRLGTAGVRPGESRLAPYPL